MGPPGASGRLEPLLRRRPWRGAAVLLKAPWPSGNMAAALLPPFFVAPLLWRASLSCCAFFSCSGSCRPVLRSSAANAERAVWKPAAGLAPWEASRKCWDDPSSLWHATHQSESKLPRVIQELFAGSVVSHTLVHMNINAQDDIIAILSGRSFIGQPAAVHVRCPCPLRRCQQSFRPSLPIHWPPVAGWS